LAATRALGGEVEKIRHGQILNENSLQRLRNKREQLQKEKQIHAKSHCRKRKPSNPVPGLTQARLAQSLTNLLAVVRMACVD
jgi:hypothetical protein